MRISLALAAALSMAMSVPAAARDVTYRNERFGTVATFPSEAFREALPEPTNGDGRAWRSDNGAELFIYARANAGGETPASIVRDRAADDTVTYRRAGDRWVVVSGFRDGKIFYERYIFRGDVIHSVAIRYPPNLRKTYDRLVGPITKTLRVDRSS
ncbi:hypothetical protein [Aureimonas sp. Leaf454]|uniref:hypothetical protein n=1 Tax=Aureimonas sp. Leaf454 TaxID=1736381 RepID=UPI001FCE293E|nr:hypothetical protein [Aureimonas sp. Leaf454]